MEAMNEWARDYDLNVARKAPSRRAEAAHQTEALAKLLSWYEGSPSPDAGGLLVLPTGGGKTFTAVRFLCRNPLSDGYKVLWLAHTHHLLEQALNAFGKRTDAAHAMEVGHIREPKERLRARVVSGTVGHDRIAAIGDSDDVVICTLQTAVRAYRERHASLRAFLAAANGKLMVVFDEAHHAPAPSYTEFLLALRREAPKMKLLGLTATPMYLDEKRAGWLPKLFPQGIVAQVSASRLMANQILAKPRPVPCSTEFTPAFDPAQFQRWRATYQDVPEDIITQLALNQERNDRIWKTYVDRREEFGKTIIFADRWFQCDYLREKLREKGVRADVVYSHVDADPGSAAARNRRSRDENAAVLRAFHEDKLDVLLNVRMLTEGTDVPKIQSVFLTRQTTSPILLRQMVGRALRGPAFGGTATANIVLFMDDWREAIQWAEFDDVLGGRTGEEPPEPKKRLPLQLVSIDLIRRLSRQMESGELGPASFLELLPLGWYVPEFDVAMEAEDTEHIRPMVLVFDDEKKGYDAFLTKVAEQDLARFAGLDLAYGDFEAKIEAWRNEFFPDVRQHGSALGINLFHLVRHLAQAGGQPPPFFLFDHRDAHDLMPLAIKAAEEDWGPSRTWQELEAVYLHEQRFWRAMFPTFDLFRSQFRSLVDGINERRRGIGGTPAASVIAPAVPLTNLELSEEVKREVIRRDGERCLCCGSTRRLQVDHIISRYNNGSNESANLQTLCSVCNKDKDIQEMHFRKTATLLKSPPPLRFPAGFTSPDLDDIAHDVQRTINMFYQCAAVDAIERKNKGRRRREWRILLRSNNPREWFDDHLFPLLERAAGAQDLEQGQGLRSFVLECPSDGSNEYSRGYFDLSGSLRGFPAAEIRPRASVAVYWPENLEMPNVPLAGKVVRVDPNKRQAEVRVTIDRTEEVLAQVPFGALFEADSVAGGASNE